MAFWTAACASSMRQSVARQRFAVPLEIEEVAFRGPLGENAARPLHRQAAPPPPARRSPEFFQIVAVNLQPDRRPHARAQHVDARLDRHGPGIGDSGQFHRRIQLIHELFRRNRVRREAPEQRLQPFRSPGGIPGRHLRHSRARLERDHGFEHRQRRRIGGGLRAAGLAQHAVHFRESS